MWFANIFEIACLVFLILGLILSFLIDSLFFKAIIILIFGMIVSTMYEYKKGLNFPYYFIIMGFLLGYLIATESGHRLFIFFLFIMGVFFGQVAKKLIKKYVDIPK